MEAARIGARAMAVTEGFGLRAAAERIARSQLEELPLVLLHRQYLPGDGEESLNCDADVALAGHLGVAGIALPVLAATDTGTTHRMLRLAFEFAERLRSPVIVLTPVLATLAPNFAEQPTEPLPPLQAVAVVPWACGAAQAEASEHGEASRRGEVSGPGVDSESLMQRIERMQRRIAEQAKQLEVVAADADPDAQTLLISYGPADQAAREAVVRVRAAGARVSHLTIYSLWPVPRQALRRAVTPCVQRILLPEHNPGLYAAELANYVKGVKLESILRYDGRPIEAQNIARRITDWPCG